MPKAHAGLRHYGFAAIALTLAVTSMIALQQHANLATVALVLLLVVTISAVYGGSGPALLASLAGMLCFNYFFIPPVHTWTIGSAENWIAFAVFLAAALTVGQLSSRARSKADEAEARRVEIERLYQQLRTAFQEASEAETLRRSEQLKTALLDSVTHDLRTPLTSIKASVTTLLGSEQEAQLASDAQRELLDVINEECDRLNRFVEEMMELARVEGGHLLLRRASTPAHDIVHAALERAGALLERHRVEITIADKLPPLQVDALSISGVVFELLENAAKYSPPGGGVHIIARAVDGAAQITVQDEGPGIPAALRERVFEKFFRAPEPQQRDRQGFGLGLAIARGIVDAHGGRIWIASGDRERGTVVSFTVPCAAASEELWPQPAHASS